MISVYLSARFARKDELRRCRDDLVAAGIECTSRWLDGEPQDMADVADMDRADVLRADVLVTFTDDVPSYRVVTMIVTALGVESVEPGTISPFSNAARGGRHVEFGMAWALGKPVFVCGPRENFAHHARDVRVCVDWAEVLGALAVMQAASSIGLDAAERKAIALTYGDDAHPIDPCYGNLRGTYGGEDG